MFSTLMKRLRNKRGHSMKNEHKRGKSARHGNAPSPYTKYKKSPYKYDTKNMEATAEFALRMNMTYIQAKEYKARKKQQDAIKKLSGINVTKTSRYSHTLEAAE